jgi:hypothetical protein
MAFQEHIPHLADLIRDEVSNDSCTKTIHEEWRDYLDANPNIYVPFYALPLVTSHYVVRDETVKDEIRSVISKYRRCYGDQVLPVILEPTIECAKSTQIVNICDELYADILMKLSSRPPKKRHIDEDIVVAATILREEDVVDIQSHELVYYVLKYYLNKR